MGHFSLPLPGLFCGRGGMADAPDLGSGVERRKSSSLFVRTVSRFPGSLYAVVAQLVECHLAKVDVAGPSPVYRSICGCSSMVELQPSKLVTWVRFPSPALLKHGRRRASFLRFPRRRSAGEKFFEKNCKCNFSNGIICAILTIQRWTKKTVTGSKRGNAYVTKTFPFFPVQHRLQTGFFL